MLVKVKIGAELSGADQEFVDCLRSYPGAGLAVVDLGVGDYRGTREVDAIVLTPHGITVADVQGFRRRQAGILHIPADGPWQIGDTAVELAEDNRGNPTDRLEHGVHEVRSMLERALLDPGHVCGVVVLVPMRGSVVRPARTNLRPGIDVVVGNAPDSTEVHRYLKGFTAGQTWTADRAFASCTALGLGDRVPSRAELIGAGFIPAPPPPASPHDWVIKPPGSSAQGDVSVRSGDPARSSDSLAADAITRSKRRQTIVAWIVVAVAVVGILIVLGLVVAAWTSGTTQSDRAGDPGPASSARPAPALNPTPPPNLSPPPEPYRSVECWPFQQGC